MVKLDSYKVEGYKNVEVADVTLNNFNVIIGTNNSGKSNFIQSISFLYFLINSPTDDLEKYFSKGFNSTNFGNIIPQISLEEPDKNVNRTIRFALGFSNSETGRKFQYSLSLSYNLSPDHSDNKFKISSESLYVKENGKPGNPVKVFSRENDKTSFGSGFPKNKFLEKVPDILSIIRILNVIPFGNKEYLDATNSLNQILKTPTFYFSHTELTKREGNDRVNVLNGRIVAFDLEDEIIKIEQTSNWNIFKASLNNILGITDVIVAKFLSEDAGTKEKKALLFYHVNILKTIKDLSDGTILLIALVTKVITSQNSLFLIEEPENSTHPKALIDLINFLQSFSETKQFIITSHSVVLLNKSKIEDIITSSILKDGLSEIVNVTSKKELKSKLRSGYVNFSDELFFADSDSEEFD